MKRLNNRGYLLVEIIVAIVLALGIAYFLMNLTIKFSKTDEDIYQSITWTNDKNILTNVIMEDIEKYTLVEVTEINGTENLKGLHFTYYDDDIEEDIEKELIINKTKNTFSYGDDYSKQISNSLEIGDIVIKVEDNEYTSIKVPITSIYSDEDYGLKIFIPYSVGVSE